MKNALVSNQHALDLEIFREKLASDLGGLTTQLSVIVRDNVREVGAAAKMMPRETVTMEDKYVSINTKDGVDLPQAILFRTHSTSASKVLIGKKPKAIPVYTKKIPVDFFQIQTGKYTKNLTEMKTLPYNLQDELTEDIVFATAEAEDRYYFGLSEAAVTTTGKSIELASPGGVPFREHIIAGLNLIEGKTSVNKKNLQVAKICMHQTLYNKILSWKEHSDGSYVNELKQTGKLLEREVVVTTKDVVQPDEIWFFTDAKYLGKFLVFEDISYVIEVRGQEFSIYAYEVVTMAIVNNEAVARVKITSLDMSSASKTLAVNY